MPTSASASPEAGETLLRSTLEAHGQRCTEQRSAVYRFLAGTDQHPSADEVFTVVRGEIPDISLATVYKALETLVSCGLAVKLTYGDDSARYDARTDDHYHSRCLSCGIVRDVPGQVMEMPRVQVAEGFRVEGFRVEVVGYCPACAASAE